MILTRFFHNSGQKPTTQQVGRLSNAEEGLAVGLRLAKPTLLRDWMQFFREFGMLAL
jgi:hypothetical protein